MTAQLLAALMLVESGNQADAIGDNGRAIGCLQITKACVRDVNRIYGTRYRWPDDCFNRYLSGRICDLYLSAYVTEERLGRKPTPQDFARAWNGGGPDGWKRKSTIPYWNKIRKHLK